MLSTRERSPPNLPVSHVVAEKLRHLRLFDVHEVYPSSAEQRTILGAIGSAPLGKSLVSLDFEVAPEQDPLRDVVAALTGPNATHTLEWLKIDFVRAGEGFLHRDPAESPWSLATIPTLRHFVLDGYPAHVISRAPVPILEDALRSRRRSGHPPLGTICLGERFSLWNYVHFEDMEEDELREYAQLVQWMCAVVKAESPTTELTTESGSLEKIVADCLILADKRAQQTDSD